MIRIDTKATQVSNQSNIEFKPVSSLEEFDEKYSVGLDKGIISLTERTTKLVLTKFSTKKEDRCIDYANPSHFYEGIYYSVLSSEKYPNAKYVYNCDPNQSSIKCIFYPLTNPHFIKNLLVNFGTGFTTPGPQSYDHSGTGVITVYDLTIQQGKKEIKKIFVEDGGCGGWDGSIDEESEEIVAFDHVRGTRLTFSVFDRV